MLMLNAATAHERAPSITAWIPFCAIPDAPEIARAGFERAGLDIHVFHVTTPPHPAHALVAGAVHSYL